METVDAKIPLYVVGNAVELQSQPLTYLQFMPNQVADFL
jgi:hypothetical protein